MSTNDENMELDDEISTMLPKKHKRGIIYLATIPPKMNVTRIREIFGQFGTVGRVYMQLADKVQKPGVNAKIKKKKFTRKFTEGWVEFEKKSVAKKVAAMLNTTQVSTRKKSKLYDIIWNIKYLPNFKWIHLNERLAYEKAARKQKLRAEITLAKKQTNFFTNNLEKHKKNKQYVNKNVITLQNTETEHLLQNNEEDNKFEDRSDFLKSLFEKKTI